MHRANLLSIIYLIALSVIYSDLRYITWPLFCINGPGWRRTSTMHPPDGHGHAGWLLWRGVEAYIRQSCRSCRTFAVRPRLPCSPMCRRPAPMAGHSAPSFTAFALFGRSKNAWRHSDRKQGGPCLGLERGQVLRRPGMRHVVLIDRNRSERENGAAETL